MVGRTHAISGWDGGGDGMGRRGRGGGRSREAGAGDVDPDPLDAARAPLLRLDRIDADARADVERPAIVVAEHAGDRHAVSGRDPFDDLTAVANPDALVR